ncbi:MAG TPA: peptidylprolyl isomerase [Myxococcales bacterium]|jgi:cyclophilin family peptidyl-prolyl cis-trans isomerase
MLALAAALLLATPYRVELATTKGVVVVEVHPEWAPAAAARFRALVEEHYYDDSRFFRVVPGKWVQFGIAGDPKVSQQHRGETIPNEGPLAKPQSNARGTIAFAFAQLRGTQVFISLADNQRLDAQGFVPFGRIIEGMNVVDALYGGYGEASGGGIRAGHQDPLYQGGNRWLDEHYPRLDKLLRARVAK